MKTTQNKTVLTKRAAGMLSRALAAAIAEADATGNPVKVNNSGLNITVDPNKARMTTTTNGNGHSIVERPSIKSAGYVTEKEMEVLPLEIEVRFNENFNPRGIEVEFSRYPGRPGEGQILKSLKLDGFRWNRRDKVWFKRDDGHFEYYKMKYTQ